MTTTEVLPASVNGSARPDSSDDVTDEVRARVREIVAEHERRPDELIQVLHEAQALLGWLPREVLTIVAGEMRLPYSRVRGVVTFYSLFTTRPRGRHTINACLGTACYVRGGRDVLEKLGETLGIAEGETTADRQFSLAVVRCVGACGLAPVVTVDDDVHKRVNPNKINDVLEGYER
jgi:NADH:ubiquinone oxidoreductase subunit E